MTNALLLLLLIISIAIQCHRLGKFFNAIGALVTESEPSTSNDDNLPDRHIKLLLKEPPLVRNNRAQKYKRNKGRFDSGYGHPNGGTELRRRSIGANPTINSHANRYLALTNPFQKERPKQVASDRKTRQKSKVGTNGMQKEMDQHSSLRDEETEEDGAAEGSLS